MDNQITREQYQAAYLQYLQEKSSQYTISERDQEVHNLLQRSIAVILSLLASSPDNQLSLQETVEQAQPLARCPQSVLENLISTMKFFDYVIVEGDQLVLKLKLDLR